MHTVNTGRYRCATLRNRVHRVRSHTSQRVCLPYTGQRQTWRRPERPAALPPGGAAPPRPPAAATAALPVRHPQPAGTPRPSVPSPPLATSVRRCRDSRAKLCLSPREGAGGEAELSRSCLCQQMLRPPSPTPRGKLARPAAPASVTHYSQQPTDRHDGRSHV